MVQPKARLVCLFDRFFVDFQTIGLGDIQGGAVNHLAIYRDPTRLDHAFDFSAACHTSARKDFGDAIAFRGFVFHAACNSLWMDKGKVDWQYGQMAFTSYMKEALAEARLAAQMGEVPVGAVIVDSQGNIVARAGNRTRTDMDPTAHAEILAIRAACAVAKSERLTGHDLYITLEPCPMCASAISQARIARVYYGAADPKSGGVAQGPRVFNHAQSHHKPEVYDGISAKDCEALLVQFFKDRRA